MQRLARTVLNEPQKSAVEILKHFSVTRQLLNRHLPPSTLTIFAEPLVKEQKNAAVENGATAENTQTVVEWYSTLQGQPIKVVPPLPADLQHKIDSRLKSIEQLFVQIKGTLSPEQQAQVQGLLDGAGYDGIEVYQINDEPVVTGWGIGKPKPKPAPIAATPVAAPVATTYVMTPHRCCCWLLPLFLLLLGFLAWWFYFRTPELPVQEPVTPPEVVQPKEEPKAEEPKVEEPKVEEPKVEEPKVEEPVVEEPPVVPAPEPEPPPAVEPECEDSTDTTEPNKMVIVFDNSPSMLLSLKEAKFIKQLEKRIKQGGQITRAEERRAYRHPNRLDQAKPAAASIIDKLGDNMDIGLVALQSCPKATNYGFYRPNKRAALKQKINKLHPVQTGMTPLVDGLRTASNMLAGRDRDDFILLISDGEESCNPSVNVCTLAAQIHKKQPRLKINVVDIGGAKAADCVARITNGSVFTANNPNEVSEMINQATQSVIQKSHCKK
ncbi:VWA domain-containing protein [Lonepinella sp. BR2474]|uniref:VWA domain-containing protein n=1 Tax=Lonepinella sp. BR2474 TaxID=3434548 RepID=UPI003F6DBC1B